MTAIPTQLSHVDDQQQPRMVDVGAKAVTHRTAHAPMFVSRGKARAPEGTMATEPSTRSQRPISKLNVRPVETLDASINDIRLKTCFAMSEDDLPVSKARVLMQWRLEYLSLRAEADQAGPPAL